MPPIRITSDGSPAGTHVYDEQGRELRVTRANWSAAGGKRPTAMIEILGWSADLEVEGAQMRLPLYEVGAVSDPIGWIDCDTGQAVWVRPPPAIVFSSAQWAFKVVGDQHDVTVYPLHRAT